MLSILSTVEMSRQPVPFPTPSSAREAVSTRDGARAPERRAAPPRGSLLGARLRAQRHRAGLTQVQLAEKVGVSASYLNLIESNKRPLPADLMLAIARALKIDLGAFAADDEAQLYADLTEAFSDDPLFEEQRLAAQEVRDFVQHCPAVARAVLNLFQSYRGTRASADAAGARLDEAELSPVDRSRISSEEVSDLIQRRMNHFPELELAAEELWRRAHLEPEDLYPGLRAWLAREYGVRVEITPSGRDPGVLRRFDPDERRLTLSELLPTRSRNFQLAHTLALLSCGDTLQRIVDEEALTVPESRALARVALANYYAGAVLMPYDRVLAAARETRYDLDVMGRRFKVSFEQIAHRVTTLRRQNAEGVAFHYLRIDVAGNISKRFSASGIRIARFSGACPRWNIFSAFHTPGMIQVQISEMPDGGQFFCIARMIHKDSGGYHAQHPIHAIGLGCRLEDADKLVYAEGIDVHNPRRLVPVGVNCRACERVDCEQRALPSARQPLQVDERVRRVSPYAPVRADGGG